MLSKKMTSADGSLRVVAGKKSSSKDYIKHRCQAVVGLTVEQALQQSFPNAAGAMTRFRRSDLDYDIKCGRLQIEVIESRRLVVCLCKKQNVCTMRR